MSEKDILLVSGDLVVPDHIIAIFISFSSMISHVFGNAAQAGTTKQVSRFSALICSSQRVYISDHHCISVPYRALYGTPD